jgi:hypothetical protein
MGTKSFAMMLSCPLSTSCLSAPQAKVSSGYDAEELGKRTRVPVLLLSLRQGAEDFFVHHVFDSNEACIGGVGIVDAAERKGSVDEEEKGARERTYTH